MILIACADDRMGISFNGRRQSSDRFLTCRLLSRFPGHLRIHPCSASLFGAFLPKTVVCRERFLEQAGEKDGCFWEGKPFPLPPLSLSQIILYRWNRHYPSDLFFPIDLNRGWQLADSRDFPGYSHNIITEEIYLTCNSL